MTRTLLWDAGPGEIRAGLVEGGRLTEFRIVRHRREGALYAAGEYYTARIIEKLGNRARVSLGGAQEALLEQANGLNQGALIAVEMLRSAIPEPGRWKLPEVRSAPGITPQREPGWHFSAEPWETFLRKAATEVDAILCPDAKTVNGVREVLGENGPATRIDTSAIDDADFDGLIESACTGEFPVNGGMLSIERTRAMTMVDIDGSGDPLALNRAAAREIPRLLRLLDIGGQIGIDFLNLPDRKARLAVDAALAEACAKLGPHERTATNGFGFVQIVRPRTGPSVPEIYCGITPRRLSVESRAIALLRTAGRTVGHGKRQLVAPPQIIDLIRQWPEETLALHSSLGVQIELVPDSSASGYGHVHVSP
jgi:ribonuclease G